MPQHFSRSRKVPYDGYVFDSKDECERYKQLRLSEKAGHIRNLEVHPVYLLHAPLVDPASRTTKHPILDAHEGYPVAKYTPDFQYEEIVYHDKIPVWTLVVEDVKGLRLKKRQDPRKKPQYDSTITARFRLNQRWMKAEYGITVQIVTMENSR